MAWEIITLLKRDCSEFHPSTSEAWAGYTMVWSCPRLFLARSWVGLKRYAEAEELYKRVMIEHAEGGHRKGSDDHLQRILAEWFLVECFDDSGKFAQAHNTAEDLLDSLAKFGDAGYGLKHPLPEQVLNKLTEIRRKMTGETGIEELMDENLWLESAFAGRRLLRTNLIT